MADESLRNSTHEELMIAYAAANLRQMTPEELVEWNRICMDAARRGITLPSQFPPSSPLGGIPGLF